ncbi:MAG: cytochrome b/b6 domain-containing protein [Xanthobacteraceae bacterium]
MRHTLSDRLYHWLMAVCIIVLMATAFLPILGVKFEWLDIHWATGVALAALILIHIVRALFFQDWRNMWIGLADLRELWRTFTSLLGGRKAPPLPGKYDASQKLYHLVVAVLVLSVVGSGLLMLLKIDTPLWNRDPYLLSADTWGVIYVVHGMAAMAIVSIFMVHLYFTLRPDNWYMLRAMVRGWVSRKEYSEHHDAARWKP